MALAIERIYRIDLPQMPLEKRSWLNIGTIKAGTAGNAMAKTAEFTVDLRSNDAVTGRGLQKQVVAILEQAAKEVGVKVDLRNISQRDPVFLNTPEQKRLIETLWASYRAIDITPKKGTIGSSDFGFLGLMQGVPSAGIGLTNIRRMHSPEEEAEIDPLFTGMKQVLLAAVALSQH